MRDTGGKAPRQFQNRSSLKHSDIALDSVLTLGDYKILTNEMLRRVRSYVDDSIYESEQNRFWNRLRRRFRKSPPPPALTTDNLEAKLPNVAGRPCSSSPQAPVRDTSRA